MDLLTGIMPILFAPFLPDGALDEDGLRAIVQFELDGGVDAVGINGFATETYKLNTDEQIRAASVVAEAVGGAVPLIIGMAPGSTEAANTLAAAYAALNPAALMVLPPNTMQHTPETLADFYVNLRTTSPVIVQQAPHIPAYSHTRLDAATLARITERAEHVRYFKIEGPGSAERIAELAAQIDTELIGLFGGGGGITLLPELRAGANGLIPGVGYNDYFVKAWRAWQAGDATEAQRLIDTVQPLVSAVSGPGHEFSLHARKHLMKRAGVIEHAGVRQPTVTFTDEDAARIGALVDRLDLRIRA